MIKVEVKGEIIAVTEPKQGKRNWYQKIAIKKPGDVVLKMKDRDNFYEFMQYADDPSDLQFDQNDIGNEVEISGYLIGYERTTDKGTFFNLSLRAGLINILKIKP
jgi:hypothetical protein